MNLDYDAYQLIFLGGLILSGLFLVTTVILFFVLKIPRVIGDLSGANARKAIEEIRSQNEQSGEKTYKPSAVNRERGKITDKMTRSGKLIKTPSAGIGGHQTAKISTMELDTEMLPAEETTVLSQPASETTVLGAAAAGETMLLQPEPAYASAPQPVANTVFAVEMEITYIHSNEVIAF